MDTEQYEEAVRDYEKVYQTEKTKGESPTPPLWLSRRGVQPRFILLVLRRGVLSLSSSRTQAPSETRPAGVEEEQADRFLQSARGE